MNYNLKDFDIKREETAYKGLYRYIAPEGYVFECCGFIFGKIIYGGKALSNPYTLKKIQ